ncbi:MAG: glycosyltransferase [Candidatus Lokiarchaeota archaeon]|nr:glycosyltransferase [Candidatus Lokiarchaeota archaeon]
MNILIITDDFYPNKGGIAHTICNLYKYLKKNNINPIIINPHISGNNIHKLILKRIDNLESILIQFFRKLKNIFFLVYCIIRIIFYRKIEFSNRLGIILYLSYRFKITMNIINNMRLSFSYLKKRKFDLILCAHGGWIFPMCFLLKIIFDKKLILMAHGNDFLVNNSLTQKSYFFKNTEKIILSNSIMKDLIKKIHHLDEEKLEIVYRALDITELKVEMTKNDLRNIYRISNEDFIILSVGRHVVRKNFDMVIQAINELLNEDPSLRIKYYLIGKGEDTNRLKSISKKFNLEKKVFFLGECDSTKRNHFYKLSDIFIMPSHSEKNSIEGFGIVFIEANYFKLPVIGANHFGIKAAIVNGKTGYRIDPSDLTNLKQKILELKSDNKKRKEMGKYGHRRVLEEYTWENVINEYIKIFSTLLSSV